MKNEGPALRPFRKPGQKSQLSRGVKGNL